VRGRRVYVERAVVGAMIAGCEIVVRFCYEVEEESIVCCCFVVGLEFGEV
jgi:hypothetical protein